MLYNCSVALSTEIYLTETFYGHIIWTRYRHRSTYFNDCDHSSLTDNTFTALINHVKHYIVEIPFIRLLKSKPTVMITSSHGPISCPCILTILLILRKRSKIVGGWDEKEGSDWGKGTKRQGWTLQDWTLTDHMLCNNVLYVLSNCFGASCFTKTSVSTWN